MTSFLDLERSSTLRISTLLKSVLVGGLLLFIWQFISWSLIPWRNSLLHPFRDEAAVSAAIVENATAPGIYILPLSRDMSGRSQDEKTKAEKRASEGPVVFAAVRLAPVRPFVFGLVAQLLTQCANALLLTFVLGLTKIRSYGQLIVFIVLLALLAGIAGHVPEWNWFNFSIGYTALEVTDLLVGWTLAGLVIWEIRRRAERNAR